MVMAGYRRAVVDLRDELTGCGLSFASWSPVTHSRRARCSTRPPRALAPAARYSRGVAASSSGRDCGRGEEEVCVDPAAVGLRRGEARNPFRRRFGELVENR